MTKQSMIRATLTALCVALLLGCGGKAKAKYQAGVEAEERGSVAEARRLYREAVEAEPDSDYGKLAKERLDRPSGRVEEQAGSVGGINGGSQSLDNETPAKKKKKVKAP